MKISTFTVSFRDDTIICTYYNDYFGSVLICTEEADYDEYDVKEVSDDGRPHEAEEVKDEPLYDRHLKHAERTAG